mmetsp:Transcript_148667/g.477385  ORF Transcript_148667/g.477385 Transcript_148667/m.477385 type:complete len:219 (-) Transcript_148667:1540-2196(-)
MPICPCRRVRFAVSGQLSHLQMSQCLHLGYRDAARMSSLREGHHARRGRQLRVPTAGAGLLPGRPAVVHDVRSLPRVALLLFDLQGLRVQAGGCRRTRIEALSGLCRVTDVGPLRRLQLPAGEADLHRRQLHKLLARWIGPARPLLHDEPRLGIFEDIPPQLPGVLLHGGRRRGRSPEEHPEGHDDSDGRRRVCQEFHHLRREHGEHVQHHRRVDRGG